MKADNLFEEKENNKTEKDWCKKTYHINSIINSKKQNRVQTPKCLQFLSLLGSFDKIIFLLAKCEHVFTRLK
jgi:hypothetical protein